MELISPPEVYKAARAVYTTLYVERDVGDPPRKLTQAEVWQTHDDARRRFISEAGKELRG